MSKVLVFDMDGTIANLYGVPNWLEALRSYDPTPYAIAEPMWNMMVLRTILCMLKDQGWEVRVVTWLSKDSTAEYDKAVREAKRNWLAEYDFPFDHFHGIKYGTTKANCVRQYTDYGVLIDDNAKVRKGWSLGQTIDPTSVNLIEELLNLMI